jgi:hypothetical protein
MGSRFYYCGRSDALSGLIPNPLRYNSSNPQEYNDYMNGYNSVSGLKQSNMEEMLEDFKEILKFKTDGKTKI